jgi:hypothetical protein
MREQGLTALLFFFSQTEPLQMGFPLHMGILTWVMHKPAFAKARQFFHQGSRIGCGWHRINNLPDLRRLRRKIVLRFCRLRACAAAL